MLEPEPRGGGGLEPRTTADRDKAASTTTAQESPCQRNPERKMAGPKKSHIFIAFGAQFFEPNSPRGGGGEAVSIHVT